MNVSDTSIELCEGKGVIEYEIGDKNKSDISFTVKKVSGCDQNQIYSTLHKSVYYRWKGSLLVYLYDKNL